MPISERFRPDIVGAFESKLKEEEIPEFFTFVNEGDTLVGQFLRETKIYFFKTKGERKVFIVRNVFDDREYSVLPTANIERLWKELDVKPKDYVMIKYRGQRQIGEGRTFKVFSISKMNEDEFNKMLAERFGIVVEKYAETKPVTLEEAVAPEVKPVPVKALEEAREMTYRILMFYKTMGYKDLVKRFEFRKLDVDIETLKEFCQSVGENRFEFDDEKATVRLRG